MKKTQFILFLLLAQLVFAGDIEDAVRMLKTGDAAGAIRALEPAVKNGTAGFEHHLYLGNAFFLSARPDLALAYYETCVKIDGGAKEARVNLASAYSALGRHSEAIDAYRAVLDRFGEMPDALFNLAHAYRFSGDLKNAETYYRRAYELRPQDPGYVQGLGELLDLQGRADDAIRLYSDALRVNPDDYGTRVSLARLFLAKGDLARAESEARAASRSNERAALPHEVLGDCYRAKNDPEMAIYEYRAALARQPNLASAGGRLAGMYEALGRMEDARLFYANAVLSDSNSIELALRYGNLLLRLGDHYGARDFLNQTRARGHKSPALLDLLGVAYIKLRGFEKARQWLGKALEMDSGYVRARFNMGVLLFEEGRHTDAISSFKAAKAGGFDLSELHLYMGRAYYQKKQWEPALDAFALCLGQDPANLEGLLWQARTFEKKGDIAGADKSHIQRTVAAPDSADAWAEAAEFYFRNRMTEKYERCVEYYERSLELNPRHVRRDEILANLKAVKEKLSKRKD